jgi:hypothetical protein
MSESVDEAMEALVGAAVEVMVRHDPGESGRCPDADCVAAGLSGRCLPYRLADQVISAWANRLDLVATPIVGPNEVEWAINSLAPGQSVISSMPVKAVGANGETRWHPPGTRLVRTGVGHPPWCDSRACRLIEDATHIGTPDMVANLMITLMQMDGDAPVVILSDMTENPSESGTVAVPVGFAASVAGTVIALGQRAESAENATYPAQGTGI